MCFCCFPNRVCTIISSTINLFVAIAGSVTFLAKSDVIPIKMPYEFVMTFGILFIIISIIFLYGIVAASINTPNVIKLYEWFLIGVLIIYLFIAITTVIYMFASKQLAIERCNNEFKTENETSIDNCDRKENILVWLRTILLILMFLLGAHTYEISRRLYKEYRRKSRKNRRPNPSLNTHNLTFI
ncbi:hypothetical protein GLOIN_2v1559958 [Rhizophagus clarus]|uniref:Uncharacterized protein n=1 Tax=Rhizophagus clarus TaxID=94130 RepID=A0A8H3M0A1_9GLOM|nr:hypothetical protein GLOIN_2v1559958 [Rhizophagus clarus]